MTAKFTQKFNFSRNILSPFQWKFRWALVGHITFLEQQCCSKTTEVDENLFENINKKIQVPGNPKMLNGFEKNVISTSFLYDESLPGGFQTSLRQKFNIKALNFHLASLLCVLRGAEKKRGDTFSWTKKWGENYSGWEKWSLAGTFSRFISPWQPSQKN